MFCRNEDLSNQYKTLFSQKDSPASLNFMQLSNNISARLCDSSIQLRWKQLGQAILQQSLIYLPAKPKYQTALARYD